MKNFRAAGLLQTHCLGHEEASPSRPFTRLRSDQFMSFILTAVWRVAEVGVDSRAAVMDAAGVRVCAEAPLAVLLAHTGVADDAERQVGDERLNRAVVDRRVPRGGRLQDPLRHLLVFRKDIEPQRAWPRVDEVDHLLDVIHLQHRQNVYSWLTAHDPSHFHRIARRDLLETYRDFIRRDAGVTLEH